MREHGDVKHGWGARAVAVAGVLGLAALVGSCSSSASSHTSSTSTPIEVSYVARSPERADLLRWTVTGDRVSGVIESRWITRSDPVDLQTASVDFNGMVHGSRLDATPEGGSTVWQGQLDHSVLILQWTSAGKQITTTFRASNIGAFDTAVQLLGEQVASASTNIANAKAADIAAATFRVKQAAIAERLAAHAAALARAEAGRKSAAKAAAHRQRPHP